MGDEGPDEPTEGRGRRHDVSMTDVVLVYRMEDDRGYGPVSRRKAKGSVHSVAIQQLIRDLEIPFWLRAVAGRQSPASGATRRRDWAFGTASLRDIRDYGGSWLGKGCALSVYHVPRPLLVEGEGEVMFWRGNFRGLRPDPAGRSHPSGLSPLLRRRVAEHALLEILDSIDGRGSLPTEDPGLEFP